VQSWSRCFRAGPRPNKRLKLTCHSSLLPACVTVWRRN
jgi:hypothetical protein